MKIDYLDNNTVSYCETRFLRGVNLVEEVAKKYNVASENYTYPYMTFGCPKDPYYAEIWSNGMDYSKTFYLLENVNYSIQADILMEIDVNDWFGLEYPKELFNCFFWMRRDRVWIKTGDYGHFHDSILPFLTIGEKNGVMYESEFEHASQKKIEFLLNKDLIFNERRDKLLHLEKSIKEVEELAGVSIETQYGNRVGKIIHSPNDPWTCDDCGNSVYNCKCQ